MTALIVTHDAVLEALREVMDPELGVNVVDLGLIYGVGLDEHELGTVHVAMTLTTPGCPLHGSIAAAAERSVKLLVPGVRKVNVHLVFDPPWSPERISAAGKEALGWS